MSSLKYFLILTLIGHWVPVSFLMDKTIMLQLKIRITHLVISDSAHFKTYFIHTMSNFLKGHAKSIPTDSEKIG